MRINNVWRVASMMYKQSKVDYLAMKARRPAVSAQTLEHHRLHLTEREEALKQASDALDSFGRPNSDIRAMQGIIVDLTVQQEQNGMFSIDVTTPIVTIHYTVIDDKT